VRNKENRTDIGASSTYEKSFLKNNLDLRTFQCEKIFNRYLKSFSTMIRLISMVRSKKKFFFPENGRHPTDSPINSSNQWKIEIHVFPFWLIMGTPNFGVWNISVSTFSGINMKPKLEIHVPILHCKSYYKILERTYCDPAQKVRHQIRQDLIRSYAYKLFLYDLHIRSNKHVWFNLLQDSIRFWMKVFSKYLARFTD
jgi:hypothetical protein